MKSRPVIDSFMRTPWIASEPLGAAGTVAQVIPRQIQVAFEGDGPMRERRLVPLTQPAHELLYGPTRDAAKRFFSGVLAQLDGKEGASRLRGMSLSTDAAGFAGNAELSMVENGFIPNPVPVRGRDVSPEAREQFRSTFQSIARDSERAKAMNPGWIDLSPQLSQQVLALLRDPGRTGAKDSWEIAQTMVHELHHSRTPISPTSHKHAWLEEGIAETLSWWPGATSKFARAAGLPVGRSPEPDPYILSGMSSSDYAARHKSVLTLLGLAGVRMRTADGAVEESARARAEQLLQAEPVEQVPKNLARAIVRQHGLSDDVTPKLAAAIVASDGSDAAIRQIVEMVSPRPRD